jgi:hypothetical protein
MKYARPTAGSARRLDIRLSGAKPGVPAWHRHALHRRRGAADFLRSGPCHFALIDPRSERSFVQRAESVALRYSLIQRIEGYNISIGKPVSMTVFRSQASP